MASAMMGFMGYLNWVDHHPQAYLCVVGGFILLAVGTALRTLLVKPPDNHHFHDWAWSGWLVGILIAGRWPSILYPLELNSDESQLMAGAHTLTADPVFWRAVNGATAGPFAFFFLWPAGWILGWDSFLASRVTAVALIALSLVVAHQCMSLVLGRQTARLAVLGVTIFESLSNGADFLHYSTELVPLFLFSLAAYAAARRWLIPTGPLWSALGGLMLGAIPLAKVQAAPLAAIMGLIWLGAEFQAGRLFDIRYRMYLVAGALTPILLFSCQLILAGEWDTFLVSYFIYNTSYVASSPSPLIDIIASMYKKSRWEDSLLHLWLLGNLAWLALLLHRPSKIERSVKIFTQLTLVSLLIAVVSVFIAGRPFLHYWQLVVLPATFIIGAIIARSMHASVGPPAIGTPWLVAICFLCLPSIILVHRATKHNFFIGTLAYYQKNPRTELANRILSYAKPEESLAMWGWANHVYVQTGLRQATRDAHIGIFYGIEKLQPYFTLRYLNDFKYSKPATFVDTVGPASFQRRLGDYRHDTQYPQLAAYVREHYTLVETTEEERIYRRNDLLTTGIDSPRLP